MEKEKTTHRFRNSFTVSIKMNYEYVDDACISKKGRCTDDVVCSAATALTPYLSYWSGFGLEEDAFYDHDSFDLFVPEEAYQVVYDGLRSIIQDLKDLRSSVTDDQLLRRKQILNYSDSYKFYCDKGEDGDE